MAFQGAALAVLFITAFPGIESEWRKFTYSFSNLQHLPFALTHGTWPRAGLGDGLFPLPLPTLGVLTQSKRRFVTRYMLRSSPFTRKPWSCAEHELALLGAPLPGNGDPWAGSR